MRKPWSDGPDREKTGAPLTRVEREQFNGHAGVCVWLTGLPGAGKTTLASGIERIMRSNGVSTLVLDGDVLRAGLSSDLGFSVEDRREQVRRVAWMARLGVEQGLVVIVAVVSPVAAHRSEARDVIGREDFLEVWVRCPVEICAARDPKGLYAQARSGKVQGVTGIDAPYEMPDCPDVVLNTSERSFRALVDELAGAVWSRCGSPRPTPTSGLWRPPF